MVVCISVWDVEKILYVYVSFGLCNCIVCMLLLDGMVLMIMDGK